MRAQHISNYFANYQEALTKEVKDYSALNKRVSPPPYYQEEYPVVESQLVVSMDVKLLPLEYLPDGKLEPYAENRGKYSWIQHQIALDNSRYIWFFAIDDVNESDWTKKPCGRFAITSPGGVRSDAELFQQDGHLLNLGYSGGFAGQWSHGYFNIKDQDFSPSDCYMILLAGNWFFDKIPYKSADCNLTIYKLVLTGKYVT